ncbi:hypothetical protein ABUL04_08765 [Micromonospora harpali]|uniref:Antitoxin Xre/MbcA/ParS-like toxin-binding domain-containing protein n=1 Tax=Micromonospora harpali TaxID=1490225 RepID=A0ABW1HPI1_9ACTN
MDAAHPRWSHASRPILVTADDREAVSVRSTLSMAHGPLGEPVRVVIETYDANPEARQPVASFPLSIRQASHLLRGMRGLLRLAEATTWVERPASDNLHTHPVQALCGLSEVEIARFLATGVFPDIRLGDESGETR